MLKKLVDRFNQYSLSLRIACLIVMASFFLFWISSYFLYCNNAFLHADFISIMPRAEGYITKIYVKNNQYVKEGDKLIEIDPTPYQLEVDSIQAQIGEASVTLESVIVGKQSAADNMEAINAQITLANNTLKRYITLQADNFVSKQQIDELTSQQQIFKANMQKAAVELTQAEIAIKKQKATIQVFGSELAKAQYQLSTTLLSSPTEGYINNMEMSVGDYVASRQSLFGLTGSSKWRIIANYKQADLAHIYIGKEVFLYIPNFPWKIWMGKVLAIGHAVARESTQVDAALPYIAPVTDWIRYPYRFPVYIEFNENPPVDSLYMGMDVYSLIIP